LPRALFLHQRLPDYRKIGLPTPVRVPILRRMFLVTEADTAAIRATFDEQGELSAAIELRRRFPGITDNAKAREYVRTIAGWKPLPAAACQIIPLRPRRRIARSAKP
jgi:hypothetical protein